ncbi:MAG TPA: 30S ribosomal protein S11 [Candidatus Saccharimonadales bacterium]|nr:30S ribosomal protein S11 [Candidatus Saccharimonadales bacterium]
MAKTITKTTRRKKTKRTVAQGQVHIQATFNNTIISITDAQGNLLSWSSAGAAGFKGSRKSTPYAAGVAAERAAASAKDFGLSKAEVLVRGVGSGRESAVRALQTTGIIVSSIKDVTGIPHNGCRPRKARRV